MYYKVTFTDGSEALAHSGVKGMKWGVWNEETAARRRGRKLERKVGKVDKAQRQAVRIERARDKFTSSRAYRKSVLKGDRKAYKYNRKAQKAFDRGDEATASRYLVKAEAEKYRKSSMQTKKQRFDVDIARQNHKSNKISRRIAKKYSDVEVASIDNEKIQLGKEYVQDFMKRS